MNFWMSCILSVIDAICDRGSQQLLGLVETLSVIDAICDRGSQQLLGLVETWMFSFVLRFLVTD